VQAHFNLGVYFANLGRFGEAIREWREVVEIEPEGDVARVCRGNIALIEERVADSDVDQLISEPTTKDSIESVQPSGDLETDWEAVKQRDTPQAYRDFLQRYPSGPYSEHAQARIVDLEVAEIMAGEHGELPTPTLMEPGPGIPHSTVNIHNDTQYWLTIRYSGPESFEVVFSPDEKGSVQALDGAYRVAASVDAPDVIPYAGQETLDGHYEVTYYVQSLGAFGGTPMRLPESHVRSPFGTSGDKPAFYPWAPKRRIGGTQVDNR
jgi:hypothetical protein